MDEAEQALKAINKLKLESKKFCKDYKIIDQNLMELIEKAMIRGALLCSIELIESFKEDEIRDLLLKH